MRYEPEVYFCWKGKDVDFVTWLNKNKMPTFAKWACALLDFILIKMHPVKILKG